jgi:hypothetical protein
MVSHITTKAVFMIILVTPKRLNYIDEVTDESNERHCIMNSYKYRTRCSQKALDKPRLATILSLWSLLILSVNAGKVRHNSGHNAGQGY